MKQTIKKEASGASFITVEDGKFKDNGEDFRFIGTNNYYLHYKDKTMIEDAIQSAALGGFNVIRMWGFFDGVDSDYQNNHAYMQPYANSYVPPDSMPSYYVNCWERMDYAVSEAKKADVKLIIVFTNYWTDFGGISQYVKWSDEKSGIDTSDPSYSPDLSKFYTDDYCKTTYKAYMNYLVNRVNTVTHVAYKDDPTIMGFELMNEPRNPGKNPSILTNWVDEMTTYFKTIDTNHLVAVGDEGHFSNRESDAYNGQSKDNYNGAQGISYDDIIKLDNVDFGTYHLYPEGWGAPDVAQLWGEKWIKDHIESSDKYNKPCICEEFGINAQNGQNRELIYSSWCKKIYDLGGAGGLFWMLAGKDTGSSSVNGYYPDYDGYRLLYLGEAKSDPEVVALSNYAKLFTYGPDFATFEDKAFLMSPYKTQKAYTNDGPVLVDSDENPTYRVKVFVRSDKEVARVALFSQLSYTGEMTYSTEGGYYYYDLPMKYFYRNMSISIYATVHFLDGTTLDSDTGYIKRELKYSFIKEKTYEMASEDEVTMTNYGNCAVEAFTSIKHSDFNGGCYEVKGASKASTYWSEFKIGVPNLGDILKDSRKVSYDVYFQKDLCIDWDGQIPSGAEATETSHGFRNYAALDPGWTKLCLNQNNIKAADCQVEKIDNVDYYKQTVEVPYSANSSQTLLVLGIVFNYLGYTGSFYIDNLAFYSRKDEGTILDGYEEPPEVTEPGTDKTPTTPDTDSSNNNLPLIISLSTVGGVAIIGLGTFFIIKNKKKHPKGN